jgi:hypothetical protein
MKRSVHIAAVIFLALATLAIDAQTVTVTSRKTVYRRPKPMHAYKRTFTVTRPVVEAATPALSKKINTLISYEKNFDFTIREELGQYQWLEEAGYRVIYNRNGILCLELWIEGSGAYPSGSTVTLAVDTARGTRLAAGDLFSDIPALARKIRSMQEAEIKAAKADIARSDPESDPDQLFADARFTAADIREFAIDASGVTFIYDYGFPHVIKALEPDGRYRLAWAELKPFIKPGGLLARFVR